MTLLSKKLFFQQIGILTLFIFVLTWQTYPDIEMTTDFHVSSRGNVLVEAPNKEEFNFRNKCLNVDSIYSDLISHGGQSAVGAAMGPQQR